MRISAENQISPITVLSRRAGVVVLFAALPAGLVLSTAAAQQPNPPYPDVKELSRGLTEKEFRDGTILCGWEALRHRMPQQQRVRDRVGAARAEKRP